MNTSLARDFDFHTEKGRKPRRPIILSSGLGNDEVNFPKSNDFSILFAQSSYIFCGNGKKNIFNAREIRYKTLGIQIFSKLKCRRINVGVPFLVDPRTRSNII